MIPKGLFTQILMVIVSGAIVVTYIKPAFVEIGIVQDNIDIYRTERDKVTLVNSQLASLVNKMQSVSRTDQDNLLIYLPDKIDGIATQRDLLLIATQAGVLYHNVEYDETASENASVDGDEQSFEVRPVPHIFTLTVDGTYEQIKTLLSLIEQNNYPLEVHTLNINPLEGGFLSAELELVTYTKGVADTSDKIDL